MPHSTHLAGQSSRRTIHARHKGTMKCPRRKQQKRSRPRQALIKPLRIVLPLTSELPAPLLATALSSCQSEVRSGPLLSAISAGSMARELASRHPLLLTHDAPIRPWQHPQGPHSPASSSSLAVSIRAAERLNPVDFWGRVRVAHGA
jgi:hypothetical protein